MWHFSWCVRFIHCSHIATVAKTTVHVYLSLKGVIILLSKMYFLVSWCLVISGFYCSYVWMTKLHLEGHGRVYERERRRLDIQDWSTKSSRTQEVQRCSVEALWDIQWQNQQVKVKVKDCYVILSYFTQSQVTLNKWVSQVWKISNYRTLPQ